MRNSLKVAKWELKRNLKNKSFIISLFLTPLLFIVFATLPSLIDNFKTKTDLVTLYVKDELNVWNNIEAQLPTEKLNWTIKLTEKKTDDVLSILKETKNSAFINLSNSVIDNGLLNVYRSERISKQFNNDIMIIEGPLRELQFHRLNLTMEEIQLIANGVTVENVTISENSHQKEIQNSNNQENRFKRIVPGVFAGIILFSIVTTGMLIFQSASQEKKEKVSEIILSSLSPEELMNGKIIGYFGLGIVQVFVWLIFIIPTVILKFDFPVIEYLFVPETLILLIIAFSGYLLFAAIYVGIGATIEDVQTAGNFQGLVIMIPFLPLILMKPVLDDPSSFLAQIASYVPVSSPIILITRLSILDNWPWIEIIIAIFILLISIWIFMKLAGKVLKIGILMYGKNATPGEIWRWVKE